MEGSRKEETEAQLIDKSANFRQNSTNPIERLSDTRKDTYELCHMPVDRIKLFQSER